MRLWILGLALMVAGPLLFLGTGLYLGFVYVQEPATFALVGRTLGIALFLAGMSLLLIGQLRPRATKRPG